MKIVMSCRRQQLSFGNNPNDDVNDEINRGRFLPLPPRTPKTSTEITTATQAKIFIVGLQYLRDIYHKIKAGKYFFSHLQQVPCDQKILKRT